MVSLGVQTLQKDTACQIPKSRGAARQENTASWCPVAGRRAEITRGDVSAVMDRLIVMCRGGVAANVLQKVGDSVKTVHTHMQIFLLLGRTRSSANNANKWIQQNLANWLMQLTKILPRALENYQNDA